MDGIKIFHMADAHLDAPFSALSPREADGARTSLRSAFSNAVQAAKNRGAQLFFIAGDLFDGENVTPDTKEFLCEKMASFPECVFFISPGNHDPYGEASHYRRMKLPANVHVFGAKERCDIRGLPVSVYGCGMGAYDPSESPVLGYGKLDGERINILVCHGDVGGTDPAYAPISRADIASSGFDYIALGHIHSFGGVKAEGGVHYAYPGCIEGRGFDETGDKGALVGTVTKGEAELAFLPLARRKYVDCAVSLDGVSTREEALALIREALKPYGGDTRVRLTLTGSPEEAFVIKADGLEGGGSLPAAVQLVDKTVPAPRITEIERENTLRGMFCRRMTARLQSLEEGSEEYGICLKALKLGLAALDGRDITGV